MSRVLAQLSEWASTLPYWEQAALDMIVSGVTFTDTGFEQLVQYLLEDAGLTNRVSARPSLCFPKTANTASELRSGPLRLEKISNFQNINALVPGQTLSFGPALTVCYGGNGSGKSGYARVLACAGFTRGDRDVLPDVTRQVCETIALSADIDVSDGTTSRHIHYQVGSPCPDLASFYVFDSTSVIIHLTKSNTLSFSPAGLAYLTRLAEVTDQVRARLQARIKECLEPHDLGSLFEGESEVAMLIADLGPKTDIERIRTLASMAPTEHRQIDELDVKIAKLRSRDVSGEIQNLEQTIADLEALVQRLREAEQRLSDEAITGLRQATELRKDCDLAAQQVSVDQFKSEHFSQIGSDAWLRFIESARELARAERVDSEPYPRHGDSCLLCHQPLSAEARGLLLRLWAFLEGEAKRRLEEVSLVLARMYSTVAGTQLDFFSEQSVAYRHLRQHDGQLLLKVSTFVEAAQRRRSAALRMTGGVSRPALPTLPHDVILDLERLITELKEKRDELQTKDCAQEITELARLRLNLQHYALLSRLLPQIEDYVRKRTWAERATSVGGSTRHITEKHNELLKGLVTDRYVELFEQALQDLKRPLKVKVRTKGQKGKTLKQIVLETDPSAQLDRATPEKVLSEGEKRAVALADFLTEVALDDTSCGIVLDDPVTSLDHEWKETLAARLVTEAKRRQVIVFTHDLPFLYLLRRIAEQQSVTSRTHWIKRGDIDGKPGYVYQDNCPALERDYRTTKRARTFLEKANEAPPEEQEALLREGFAALRTTYEAFIIFDILNEVVMRFEERLSFGRLKKVVWDQSIVDTVVDTCERLSRHIEGHLHSDAFSASRPAPKTLLGEIEAFEALKRRHRHLADSA